MIPVPEKQPKAQFNLRANPELMLWVREQSIRFDCSMNHIVNHAIKQLRKTQESQHE